MKFTFIPRVSSPGTLAAYIKMNIKITLCLAIVATLSGCATQMVHENHGTLHETKWNEITSYEKTSSGDYIICVSGDLAQRGSGSYQIDVSKWKIKITDKWYDKKYIRLSEYQIADLSPSASVKTNFISTLQTPLIGDDGEEHCIILPGWDNGTDVIIHCYDETTYDTKGKLLFPFAVAYDVITLPAYPFLIGFSFLEQ